MRNIYVYSKEAAKKIVETFGEPFIWISIRTEEEDPVCKEPSNGLCLGKLDLSFHDTTLEENPDCFDPYLASQVVTFVDQFPEDTPLVVNCEAGVSRSAGIAVGLHERGGVSSPVRNLKPHFNVLVANLVRRHNSCITCKSPEGLSRWERYLRLKKMNG